MNGFEPPDDFDHHSGEPRDPCEVIGPLKWYNDVVLKTDHKYGSLSGANHLVIGGYEPLIESTIDLRVNVPVQLPRLLAWWAGHKERRDRYFNDAAEARSYLEQCAREEGYEIV